MKIYPEIKLSKNQHNDIEQLRNKAFPDHQVDRSYYKQLPHMRALNYHKDQLVGYMGLDYRVISVGTETHKVLGVIDFCIDEAHRGLGIGSAMLSQLSEYACEKDVDFIILISELHDFYCKNNFERIDSLQSWLRIHEHKSYGVAVEQIGELYIKKISGKSWGVGDMDWLGYMY